MVITTTDTVTVPRWALECVIENATDPGIRDAAEMERAHRALQRALEVGDDRE